MNKIFIICIILLFLFLIIAGIDWIPVFGQEIKPDLKLKADKSLIIENYDIKNGVRYAYKTDKEVGAIKYKDLDEVMELRTKDYQVYKVKDNKYIMRTPASEDFIKENGKWLKYEWATTTKQAFQAQTLSFWKKFIHPLLALTNTASTNVKDTELRYESSDTNYGIAVKGFVGYQNVPVTGIYHSIFHFTLPEQPEFGVISEISFFDVATTTTDTINAELHELTPVSLIWVESEATWNATSTGTGHTWLTAGGDYSTTVVSSTTISTKGLKEWHLRGTEAYNSIDTLDWNGTVQFLLKEKTETGGTHYCEVVFKENTTVADRPYLEITYTIIPQQKNYESGLIFE